MTLGLSLLFSENVLIRPLGCKKSDGLPSELVQCYREKYPATPNPKLIKQADESYRQKDAMGFP